MTAITFPIDLDIARERITATYRKAIKNLIDVGQMLDEVRDNLQDGQTFTAFINTLPFSPRSAYNYIKLYDHYLVHGDVMTALERVKIDVWYQLQPDSELTQKVIERAQQGKSVNKKDLKRLTASIEYATVAQAEAWDKAVDTSPNFVLESFKRGLVTDLDGNDIPVSEADATLIEVLTDEDKHERTMRQKFHIEAHSEPKRKLTLKLQALRDNHGVIGVGVIIPGLELDSLNLDIEVDVYPPVSIMGENAA